ncbi:helix-turn-helix domain-containing protein [Glutamicibacter sp. 2E12]|uniref:helix-turn-helix domain-containing protein n=1 Tax=Glutamicibacter sp. 2E12 TaxID=3416181 RepID=UPI003CF385D3
MSDIDEKGQESESTYVRFGEIVRNLRMKAGLTQTQLSKALAEYGLDMRQNTITKLEKGARPTTLKECIALAQALGMQPAELFQQAFPATAVHSNELQRLLAKEAQLDRELDEVESQVSKTSEKLEALRLAHSKLVEQIWHVRHEIMQLEGSANGDD